LLQAALIKTAAAIEVVTKNKIFRLCCIFIVDFWAAATEPGTSDVPTFFLNPSSSLSLHKFGFDTGQRETWPATIDGFYCSRQVREYWQK
jgi:hypothetical protein